MSLNEFEESFNEAASSQIPEFRTSKGKEDIMKIKQLLRQRPILSTAKKIPT